jgi:hypothetical protein
VFINVTTKTLRFLYCICSTEVTPSVLKMFSYLSTRFSANLHLHFHNHVFYFLVLHTSRVPPFNRPDHIRRRIEVMDEMEIGPYHTASQIHTDSFDGSPGKIKEMESILQRVHIISKSTLCNFT